MDEKNDELFSWLDTQRRCYTPVREIMNRAMTRWLSMYEGFQWFLGSGTPSIMDGNGGPIERFRNDLNPDSPWFRPVMNRTSRFVQRASTATAPIKMEVEVLPPQRDMGIATAVGAQACEDLIQTVIDHSGLLGQWDDANFARSIVGSCGIGWCLKPSVPGGEPQLSAFHFLPNKLTLDTECSDRRLERHPYVIYSDAWTIHKIRRVYGPLLDEMGVTIEDADLDVMRNLTKFELECNAMTSNLLYSQYRDHSETRGAYIHQIHRRDETGRFGMLDIVLELKRTEGKYIKLSASESPFGFDGLPLTLIHGHRRIGAPWSIGDVEMLKDDQLRLNRTNLNKERLMIYSGRPQWVVDENTMGRDKSPGAIMQRFHNAVMGIILYEGGNAGQRGMAPELKTIPPPPEYLARDVDSLETAMREQVHRAAIHSGETQPRTPLGAVEIAREEAGQVLDKRVHEDRQAAERFTTVALGTVAKLVQSGSPETIGMLRRNGFTENDFAEVASIDPNHPPYQVKVRESSIRLRSSSARRQALDTALQLQAISPVEYRREMASGGLDTPLTQSDRAFQSAFERYALRVLLGEEWKPEPLGPRGMDLVESFRLAMVDRRADQAAKDRLARAIQAQSMLSAQEVAALQMASTPPTAEGQQAGQPEPQEGGIEQLAASIQPGLAAA